MQCAFALTKKSASSPDTSRDANVGKVQKGFIMGKGRFWGCSDGRLLAQGSWRWASYRENQCDCLRGAMV